MLSGLIDGFCKEGNLKEAMDLLHEMFEKNIYHNVVTYNGLIDGFCKEGNLKEAMEILHEVAGKNVYPNVVT